MVLNKIEHMYRNPEFDDIMISDSYRRGFAVKFVRSLLKV